SSIHKVTSCRVMPERVIKVPPVVSPLDAFGGKTTREHRIRVVNPTIGTIAVSGIESAPLRELDAKIKIRSQQTYMNLTDAFVNNRMLSIFKQCCEKGTRRRSTRRRPWASSRSS